MSGVTSVVEQIRAQRERYVSELSDFLRIPSVSADSTRREDMKRCAAFVAQKLTAAGLETRICDTPGHPIVYAEKISAPGRPTILIYGHYDVQPPDPLELWTSPPFEPRIADGNIYARGATDDKGQLYTHIKSVEAYHAQGVPLPINVKFIIEGEEEIASPSLDAFLVAEKQRLACDYALISDTAQFGAGMPAITYGLRGICYMELRVDGPAKDLHSGAFGGTVANPAAVLVSLLESLKDDDGRVLLPGFYDDVRPLDPDERRRISELPFDEAGFLAVAGSPELVGEKEYGTLERRWARPTLEINGIFGGYQGEGSKTIVPAWAGAKVSMRLVPDQDHVRVAELFEKTVKARCPSSVKLTVKRHSGGQPIVVPTDSAGVRAMQRAIRKGYGADPVFIRSGGTIPVVGSFKRILDVDTLLLGWGRPDDNVHSPNEKFNLGDYQKAIETSAFLLSELADA